MTEIGATEPFCREQRIVAPHQTFTQLREVATRRTAFNVTTFDAP
jgi:hypothetical protein